MRKSYSFIFFCFISILLAGCEKKREPNKIVDGFPIISDTSIVPAIATQHYFLLKRDFAIFIIPVLNKLPNLQAGFGELSGPTSGSVGSSQYTSNQSESRYGSAVFTIQFKNESNADIDPITLRSSTASVKSVVAVITSNAPDSSTLTENLLLTLQVAGDVASEKRITGTSNFTGSSYSITYTIVGSGITIKFEGPIDGTYSATGTGPTSLPVEINQSYRPNNTVDGNMNWEGKIGSLYIADNGTGFVLTETGRILFD